MRKSTRQYHTQLGWYVMTHDRGGPAVIGIGAAVVLVADLVYTASHWSGSFPRSFLVSFFALLVVGAVAFLARFVPPLGPSRRAARWNQRVVKAVFIVVLFAYLRAGDRLGGNSAGEILGAIAILSGGFALVSVIWVRRQDPEDATGGSPP